jgi:DNA polymerase/3'-5' exonuclease PolX
MQSRKESEKERGMQSRKESEKEVDVFHCVHERMYAAMKIYSGIYYAWVCARRDEKSAGWTRRGVHA